MAPRPCPACRDRYADRPDGWCARCRARLDVDAAIAAHPDLADLDDLLDTFYS